MSQISIKEQEILVGSSRLTNINDNSFDRVNYMLKNMEMLYVKIYGRFLSVIFYIHAHMAKNQNSYFLSWKYIYLSLF